MCSDELQWRSQEEPDSRLEELVACPEVIPNLTPAEVTKIVVRRVLHKPLADFPLAEVIDRVSKEVHVSRASVKAAIWELYADGYLELTANWDLRETRQAAAA
jgi:hypothetical protein